MTSKNVEMRFVNFFRKVAVAVLMAAMFCLSVSAQDDRKVYPAEVTLEEQFEYITSKSSSWDLYKLIYTEWINKLQRSAVDSLNTAKNEIVAQKKIVMEKNTEIGNLQQSLNKTKDELAAVLKEKNSLTLLGLNIPKGVFLTVTIIIIIGLAAFAVIAYGLFKHGYIAMRRTQDELNSVSKDFDAYRQESRKKQEQLVVQHHREIQKLKGL